MASLLPLAIQIQMRVLQRAQEAARVSSGARQEALARQKLTGPRPWCRAEAWEDGVKVRDKHQTISVQKGKP